MDLNAEPLISFVIPAWNAATTLDQTLESVSRQSLGEWEIVIVDDGSSDETPTIARRWAAEDSRIRLLTQTNRGYTAARNAGLNSCHGRWICFIDADDLIANTYIEETAACFDATRDVDIVVCAWKYLFSDGSCSSANIFADGYVSQPLVSVLDKPIIFGSAVIRSAVAKRVQFDDTLAHSGDFWYWCRLAQAGVRIVGISQCLFSYRQLPGSLSRRDPLQCLMQDLDVWTHVAQTVPAVDNSKVTRRKQIALMSYACRMIATGKDPFNALAEANFPLLLDIRSEVLAVNIYEMLPLYLGRHENSWPLFFTSYAQPILTFLERMQRQLNLEDRFAETTLLRLKAFVFHGLLTSIDSSSCERELIECLRVHKQGKHDIQCRQDDDKCSGADRTEIGYLFDQAMEMLGAQGEGSLPIEVDMRAGSKEALSYQAGGWSMAEDWGTWTDGPEARLLFSLCGEMPGEVCLEIGLEHVFCPDTTRPLRVSVEVNKRVVKSLFIDYNFTRVISATIPGGWIEPSGGMLVVLRIDGSLSSPKSLGLSPDTRRLGLGVSRITLRRM